MSKKKTIAVAIVLALILLIGGMLAYFTDTDVAVNKFSLGDEIDIEISEAGGWTKDANTNDWTNSNANGIHPGTTVTKAPSIVNNSFTTPAYVFAKVVVPCYDSNNDGTVDAPLYTFTANSGWTEINGPATVDSQDGTITYIYAYGTDQALASLPASTPADAQQGTPAVMSTTSTAVFSSVTLASALTAEQAEDVTDADITVTAYGIQTDGLASASPATIFTYLPQI